MKTLRLAPAATISRAVGTTRFSPGPRAVWIVTALLLLATVRHEVGAATGYTAKKGLDIGCRGEVLGFYSPTRANNSGKKNAYRSRSEGREPAKSNACDTRERRRTMVVVLCAAVMHHKNFPSITRETVREGFEPSVAFWTTAL